MARITTTLKDWQGEKAGPSLAIIIESQDSRILVETTDGRTVSIELENGDLRVHGYHAIKDAPCSLRIGTDRDIEVEAEDYHASERLTP